MRFHILLFSIRNTERSYQQNNGIFGKTVQSVLLFPFKYSDKWELELVGSAIKAKLSTHDSVQMVPVSRLPLYIYLSAFRDWRSKD